MRKKPNANRDFITRRLSQKNRLENAAKPEHAEKWTPGFLYVVGTAVVLNSCAPMVVRTGR
jgi:hypothetical protein